MPLHTKPAPPPESQLPACAVCGGHQWPKRMWRTLFRRCPSCGTVLHDRSSTRQDEERQYEQYSFRERAGLEAVAQQQWNWVRAELFPGRDPASLKVLDVGCGAGWFLVEVRKAGATTAGVELDAVGAAACREQGLDVWEGSLFDVGVPEGPWDLITLWDVLEHLEDPGAALALLAPRLKGGGLLVTRGRNARFHVPVKLFFRRASWIKRLGIPDPSVLHRWGLRPEGFVHLLEAAGLEQIRFYHGLPTPGDRYRVFGPRVLANLIKGGIRGAGLAVHRLSGGRLNIFPSILMTARRPVGEMGTPPSQAGDAVRRDALHR